MGTSESFSRGKKHAPKPEQVLRAKYEGDTAALRAMGKAGADARAKKKYTLAIEKEMLSVQRSEEHLARQKEANEDILPLD